MALTASISTEAYDKLDDVLKKEYKKDGDKYVLDVIDAGGLSLINPENLKSALASEREEVKNLKKKLREFEDLDPEAARDALSRLKKVQNDNKAAIKEATDSAVAEVKKKFNEDIAAKETLVKRREAQIQKLLIDQQITKELSGHKLVDGGAELALTFARPFLQVTEDQNGEFRAIVVDAQGRERPSLKPDSPGNMTVAELVETMREHPQARYAFAAGEPSGTGGGSTKTTRTSGGFNGKNPLHKDSLNLTEASRLRQSDPAAFRKAAVEAGLDPDNPDFASLARTQATQGKS